MHVLLTRPSLQADLMRPMLEERGCTVSVDPILDVTVSDQPDEALMSADILIVTSRYASLHILKAAAVDKTKPIYAVGAGTAAPLRKAGFVRVFAAGGDATSLIDLIVTNVSPTDGSILYLSGRDITTDIAGALAKRGYHAHRVVVYSADPARALRPGTQSLLRRQSIDCAVFMSFRTSRFFSELCHAASLTEELHFVTAAALSNKVASGLERDRWKDIKVAEEMSRDGIIALLCPKD